VISKRGLAAWKVRASARKYGFAFFYVMRFSAAGFGGGEFESCLRLPTSYFAGFAA